MKQIKTIQARRDNVDTFDKRVNEALLSGWELKERFLAPGFTNSTMDFHPVWVATLEREVGNDENH